MNTKKILAGALSCMMFACAFTACGDKDSDEKSSGSKIDDNSSYIDSDDKSSDSKTDEDSSFIDSDEFPFDVPTDEYMICAKEYSESTISKDGGETFSTYIYPDSQIDEYKAKNTWDDLIEDMNNYANNHPDNIFVEVTDIKADHKLENTELKGAEYIFIQYGAGDDIVAVEGYEIKADITTTNTESNESFTLTKEFCIIKFESESSWKVIQSNAKGLEAAGSLNKNTQKSTNQTSYGLIFYG